MGARASKFVGEKTAVVTNHHQLLSPCSGIGLPIIGRRLRYPLNVVECEILGDDRPPSIRPELYLRHGSELKLIGSLAESTRTGNRPQILHYRSLTVAALLLAGRASMVHQSRDRKGAVVDCSRNGFSAATKSSGMRLGFSWVEVQTCEVVARTNSRPDS